jgi:hypothetical protein
VREMGATESDPAEASLRFPLLLAQRKKWAVVAVVWFTGWADKWAGGSRAFFFFFFFSFYLFLSLLNAYGKCCLVNAYGKYHLVSSYYF